MSHALTTETAESHGEENEKWRKPGIAGRGPKYEAAVMGFKNYWYPVMRSRQLKGKPVPVELLGQKVMLMRHERRAYALHDQCAHRGVPLSKGRRYFPGHITCAYHGFTYDIRNGKCTAVLTAGPHCPLVGKASVRSYPVEERAGFIWIYMGDEEPPPLEDDLPEEMLGRDVAIECRISDWKCNWRAAVENGTDHAHVQVLHRRDLWWLLKKIPAWRDVVSKMSADGKWLERESRSVHMTDDYPGVGQWPRGEWYRFSPTRVRSRVRLPCIIAQSLMYPYKGFHHLRWAVPVNAGVTRNFQFAVRRSSLIGRFFFHLQYWLWDRWFFHILFNGSDKWILERLDYSAPERMFAPDRSIIDWRRLCENAR